MIDGIGADGGGTQSSGRSTLTGALRAGGFDFAQIGSGQASRQLYLRGSTPMSGNQVIPVLASAQARTSRHNVAGAAGAADTLTVECDSCHDPDGNGNYRVLRRIPDASGGWTPATGVTVPEVSAKVYATASCWVGGGGAVAPVVGSVPVGTALPPCVGPATLGTAAAERHIANVITWCTTCHFGQRVDPDDSMGGRTA